MQNNKSAGTTGTRLANGDAEKSLLRGGEKPAAKGLLRKIIPEAVFSKRGEESGPRHFFKAYAYRIYTSVGVTPLITLATLSMKQKYGLDNVDAAFLLGGIEFVVKPFTYAVFEWGASHVKLGYRNGNGTTPMGLAEKKPAAAVFTKEQKEGWLRHFVKAYGYRIYTSVCVTPLIAVGTLWVRQHYSLDNSHTVLLQSGAEFVVKPFTYALFEYAASHVKPGYRKGAAVPPRTEAEGSGK